MHKPAPGLSQLEHNFNSLCVSTRTQSRSLWEAGALVPPRSPAFLREAGKTKAGGNEHIRSFGDGPAVSANLPIHSPRASGMFLSLIKLLERQLEPGQGATVCNRVWVCEADGEKRIKIPSRFHAALPNGAITSRLPRNFQWSGIMSACQLERLPSPH